MVRLLYTAGFSLKRITLCARAARHESTFSGPQSDPPRRTSSSRSNGSFSSRSPEMDMPRLNTPKQLHAYLSDFVVGQEGAKKVLSVGVFNHYNRVRSNLEALEEAETRAEWLEREEELEGRSGVSSARVSPHPGRPSSRCIPLQSRQPSPLFEKSNILVIGPTGSGKTLLARTLAKVLDVPFSVSDATAFTQAGYVGEDVDMCIHRLLQSANWDANRASTGIVYIDEIDKIARKGGGNGGTEGTRDVGGEGVQQSLLRLLEGSVVTVQAKGPAVEGPGAGSGSSSGGRAKAPASPKAETYHIDTSNVLFILSGAFVGLDTVIKRRVAKGSIGFTATLTPTEDDDSKSFLPFFTPNRVQSNLLDLIEPGDLVKYGFIPEFISRLPSITSLAPLSIPDLRRVLVDVKKSLISQYTALFGYSGVEIKFTGGALDEICKKAHDRGGGARGLRGIMETLLLDPMYEVPGSTVRHVLITEAVVRGEVPPLYWNRGESNLFFNAWAREEDPLGLGIIKPTGRRSGTVGF